MFNYKTYGGHFLMQFEQLVKEYLLELKLGNYSKKTMAVYEQHISKFIDFYKEKYAKKWIFTQLTKSTTNYSFHSS